MFVGRVRIAPSAAKSKVNSASAGVSEAVAGSRARLLRDALAGLITELLSWLVVKSVPVLVVALVARSFAELSCSGSKIDSS
ncbi:MAG: hypothetical protein B7X48_09670 [Acidiphilium sp. 34-60-192]|nr:MAG: hypothetical protein B7X48_09670 [Acidiphilium sp. 34-60-192]